jgi:hypothetical protein
MTHVGGRDFTPWFSLTVNMPIPSRKTPNGTTTTKPSLLSEVYKGRPYIGRVAVLLSAKFRWGCLDTRRVLA